MELTNRDYGKLCRKALMVEMARTFGDIMIEGIWLKSLDKQYNILSLYSNLNEDRWFYGIGEIYWRKWDKNNYLVFLMRDGKRCDYVLLSHQESIDLISRINLSKDNDKLINIRIPAAGRVYIQEWQEFPLESRMKSIGNINPEEAKFEKLVNKYGIETLKKALIKINFKS